MTATDCSTQLTQLAADPFTALAVHFGMLLGVSDVELLDSHPRGKLRLHNAWLHGEGVAWGYRVTFDRDRGEVQVDRGLATDANGRELYLAHAVCVRLQAWYDEWVEAGGEAADATPAGLALDVVATHRACLARPVPAVAGECDDGPATAYSRILETVEIELVPSDAAARATPAPGPFARLQRLLGGAAFGDVTSAADTAAADVAALPPGERRAAWLAALQAMAAEDSLARQPKDVDPPGIDQFPAPEVERVLLASLVVVLDAAGAPVVQDGSIDHGVRRVHVPTTVVADLLAAAAPGPDAGGPRLDPATAKWDDDKTIRVTSSIALDAGSLTPTSVVASRWVPGTGWAATTTTPTPDGKDLVVGLGGAIAAGETVRVLVTGTGATPVVADVAGVPVPLAGLTGDLPAGPDQGRDAVITMKGA